MFTGIVEELGEVMLCGNGKITVLAKKTPAELRVGGSIAVNGVCLTATQVSAGENFTCDVVPETLSRTNLGELEPRTPVNLELPLRAGGPIGGHFLQGHVEGTGRILSKNPEGNSQRVWAEAPPNIIKYVVEKGFVGVDGVSLTVAGTGEGSFAFVLIPATSRATTLGTKKAGDFVNIETDMIAKYLERFADARGKNA